MLGTIFALIAAVLALFAWIYAGAYGMTMGFLALGFSLVSFFVFQKEAKENVLMFFGCLLSWLLLIVRCFLAVYV
jgi:hypothetical protein